MARLARVTIPNLQIPGSASKLYYFLGFGPRFLKNSSLAYEKARKYLLLVQRVNVLQMPV
ncbi:hypothetical protein GCM10011332_10160 [Terasakiella brassicae]|uniref:Uncharacterized protein n=1 Tax=Terasakiella brassicae TaxID=1634917 RepID=A0A917BW38_9PROT|nr:hypothetical protein GCM10011332_10160 [Terasakiella brassicae]